MKNIIKKALVTGVLVVVMAALIGIQSTGVAAEQSTQTWTVFVHLAYADGTSYDVPLAQGVPTSRMTSILQDCGRSHWTGSVVRYHCYPVPE